MTNYQLQKQREKRFIFFCALIFIFTLLVGTREERKEKYKVNPYLVIKSINDERENKLNEK